MAVGDRWGANLPYWAIRDAHKYANKVRRWRTREDLPMPTPQMTPEQKGQLLLLYVKSKQSPQRRGPMGELLDSSYPDFSSADLSDADLTKADLDHIDLRGANLSGAKLDYADFSGTILDRCCAPNSSFIEADLKGASLCEADLQGGIFTRARLDGAKMRKAKLMGAIFEQTDGHNIILEEADLSRAILESAHFGSANLSKARLHEAKLSKINLRYSNLGKADLQWAVLGKAEMKGVDLHGATLRRAHAEGADLRYCNLDGTNLDDTKLGGADLSYITGTPHIMACRITAATYIKSGWTLPRLIDWHNAGAIIEDLHNFPSDIQNWFRVGSDGLTLYFNTSLTPFDRFLVDGIIFGVLGKDTNCRVVEFRELGNSAIVRLEAEYQHDLELVAEALYRRVWEAQEHAQRATLVRLAEAFGGQQIHAGLSNIRARLEQMSLSPEPAPALEDGISRDLANSPKQAWYWNLENDHITLPRPVRLFLSYSHKDSGLREEFETHLALLKHQGVIETWTDQAILPGHEWDKRIKQALIEADIIVLFISPDFIASEYIAKTEIPTALERHNAGSACVIPVVVRPTDWASSLLGKLQALPPEACPVTIWENRDAAWVEVAHGIRQAIMHMASEIAGRRQVQSGMSAVQGD